MARSGEAGLADATLKVQCELFVQDSEGGARDANLFATLALMLLPNVSEATARHVAGQLAPHPRTPPEVLAALEARGGGVAQLVIERATVLPAALQADAAAHADPRLAASLAARADITDDLQSALLDRSEPTTLQALAGNRAIRLSRHAASNLIAAAASDAGLARLLLERADLDSIALLPLYLIATPAQKAGMREVLDLRLQERGMMTNLPALSQAAQEELLELSLNGLGALLGGVCPLVRQSEGFITAATEDSSRELTCLALMAAGITASDAIRMLLRTGDAVALDSARLGQLVELMRSTSRQAATILLATLVPKVAQVAEASERTTHVPAMVPGGTPSRAAQAVPARRPPHSRNLETLRSSG